MGEVAVVDQRDYISGSVDAHDATIYLGLRPGVPVPAAFLADSAQAQYPVCWIGAKLDELLRSAPPDRYGFTVQAATAGRGASKVLYEDGSYWRDAPDWQDQYGMSGHPVTNLAGKAYGGGAIGSYRRRPL